MDLMHYQAQKPFAQKHLLTLADYAPDEILQVLSLALALKQKQKQAIPHRYLEGKTLAMIFSKSSTRTRVSFETGMYQLGGQALFLSNADIQLGRGETIADTAQVLSRYVDGIMIRTFKHSDAQGLAQYGTIPVINGLTDDYHPCQALADMMTIYENYQTLAGLKLAYIGDGNNMAHSLMIAGCKLGMEVAIASPKGYEPTDEVQAMAASFAKSSGGKLIITNQPLEAAQAANILYSDVWASMGHEHSAALRMVHFAPYQITAALMGNAAKDAIFLHCLPAHRGEEVVSEVIDGPQSRIFDQAENRLHAQKAIMVSLMKDGPL